MIVEQLARALGVPNLVKHDIDDDPWGYTVEGSGEIRFYWHDASGPGGLESRVVDEGTALIFLLVLASGLRLDVGRCRACEGSRIQKEFFSDKQLDYYKSPCPECSEPGPPVACKVCHGRGSQVQVINVAGCTIRQGDRVPLTVKLPAHVLPMFRRDSEALTFMGDGNDRPCHDCNETGKRSGHPQPTGRRIFGAEAILEAMPRPGEGPYTERVDDDFGGHDIELWVPPESGDQTVRDALAVHADRLQADGDPLGELLAAWLRGPCRACEGKGDGRRPAKPGDPGWPHIRWWEELDGCCSRCRGHGTVLGALWEELDALAAEWCERLEDATAS
jgi:hypothetical protein